MKKVESTFLRELLHHGREISWPNVYIGSFLYYVYAVRSVGGGVVSIHQIETFDDLRKAKNARFYTLNKCFVHKASAYDDSPSFLQLKGNIIKKAVVAKRVTEFVPKKTVKAVRVKKDYDYINPYAGTQKEVLFKMIKYHSGFGLRQYARIVSLHNNTDFSPVLRWMQRRISELIRDYKVVVDFTTNGKKIYYEATE